MFWIFTWHDQSWAFACMTLKKGLDSVAGAISGIVSDRRWIQGKYRQITSCQYILEIFDYEINQWYMDYFSFKVKGNAPPKVAWCIQFTLQITKSMYNIICWSFDLLSKFINQILLSFTWQKKVISLSSWFIWRYSGYAKISPWCILTALDKIVCRQHAIQRPVSSRVPIPLDAAFAAFQWLSPHASEVFH